MCGYLCIQGLTEVCCSFSLMFQEFPVLTTYFEAEIIGPRHSFLTRKWQANEQQDRQHWSMFSGFKPIADHFNDDGFVYKFWENDHMFMRWKGNPLNTVSPISLENFLVPDHKIRSVNGASFEGFYYICYENSTQTFLGYYYHQNSEWYVVMTVLQINAYVQVSAFAFDARA